MEDEEITLCNACTDLVTLKANEAFPSELLRTKRAGEWVRARDFCAELGINPCDLKAEIFATWLPDPGANGDYAVVMFYDDDSKWSMAAHYNRERLSRQLAAATSAGTADPAPAA